MPADVDGTPGVGIFAIHARIQLDWSERYESLQVPEMRVPRHTIEQGGVLKIH
jgi:hypothetical protein